jgi:hypothetical protein
MNTTQQIALSLYAGGLTVWVAAAHWRLSRITDSPAFALIGVLFTLCFAAQAACVAIAAASLIVWVG